MVVTREASAITLSDQLCSRCLICYTACPFEAITLEKEKPPKINLEKCLVCGICASVCPSGIIEPYYYSYPSLISEIKAKKTPETKSLVVVCRGSGTPSCQVLDVLKDRKVENPIFIQVPCAGRLPTEFYLSALSLGIKQIVAIQCSQEFCRFTKGSELNHRRVEALQGVLEYFGYGDNALTLFERSQQVQYDSSRCVGCDKCIYICPYEAIKAQSWATPTVIYEKCKGCGACDVICPHLAMEVRGFEYERLSSLIQSYSDKVKEVKAQGISPVVAVFCCQWAEFAALDQRRDGFVRPNVALVAVPCFSKLDPINVFQAFRSGFDGVLAVVCLDDDCKSKEARVTTEENMKVLRIGLKKLGLDGRFKVHKTSPRNIGDFDREVDSFIASILALKKG